MYKKLLSIVLTLVMFGSVLAVVPVNAKSKYKVYRKNDFVYTVIDDYVQLVSYTGESPVVEIPSEMDGYPVKKLGNSYYDNWGGSWAGYDFDDGGFSYNEYLEEVIIPDCIEVIEDYSFYMCKNLRKVKISNGIKEVSSCLFAGCSKLKGVKLPSSITTIGRGAFALCESIKEFDLPPSVTKIEKYAFYKSGLKRFKIGKNVKKITSHNDFVNEVFLGTKIKRIIVSKDNEKYCAKDGVLYNKDKTRLIYYPELKKAKSFAIPKTVNKVSMGAFEHNKYLQSVVIPKGVEDIRDYAFNKCKKLSKVKFKNGKDMRIKNHAFLNCKSLKTLYLPESIKKITPESIGFYHKVIVKGKYAKYKLMKMKDFTIRGKSGSRAEKYAKQNGFNFVAN